MKKKKKMKLKLPKRKIEEKRNKELKKQIILKIYIRNQILNKIILFKYIAFIIYLRIKILYI